LFSQILTANSSAIAVTLVHNAGHMLNSVGRYKDTQLFIL
jgi:hypothetical protein